MGGWEDRIGGWEDAGWEDRETGHALLNRLPQWSPPQWPPSPPLCLHLRHSFHPLPRLERFRSSSHRRLESYSGVVFCHYSSSKRTCQSQPTSSDMSVGQHKALGLCLRSKNLANANGEARRWCLLHRVLQQPTLEFLQQWPERNIISYDGNPGNEWVVMDIPCVSVGNPIRVHLSDERPQSTVWGVQRRIVR